MTTPTPSSAPAPRRPGASIGDVARLAGVSAQTVSRVSNEAGNVLPATRQRVLDAMEQLGYAPNRAARALRTGSFAAIGVVVHRLARTGESGTVDAIVDAARREGYTVNLVDVASPSSDDVAAALQRLSNQSVDGLIIVRAETATPTSLALPPRTPVVVADSRFVGHHPAVGADQVAGASRAVQHLLDLGHATVHLLAGPVESGPAQLRAQAWRSTLERAGRGVPAPVQGDWSAQSGYEAGRLLAQDPAVTAVFSANDEMATGLLHALHEAGRRVPQDVSVVGFDDIPLASHLWPPLTTVRQDFTRVGEELVRLLLEQIRSRSAFVDRNVVVPAPLIERASTAPPPPR
ncbi:LacI family DNA-binding transcriptional regulator [Cellulomonas sp. PhB150]|uniref:LacI family DNA-binding transcriptional regulator n=1 Tax=Cellulomonas sp. PhB150 TaxID=2485188 RepID=UPI000F4821FE|nr:LacI family DNA-binding transcriptional regulator [Cellulomonas sp. PhB150]ROS31319.1 LacI family transcriptional regulator [Cellulomonas sp. PhB150]